MHLQVAVFHVERQRDAFARDGGAERRHSIEVERVTKFIRPRSAAGFNAGSPGARVGMSIAWFAERTKPIAQGFETEESEALIGSLEAHLTLIFANLAGGG